VLFNLSRSLQAGFFCVIIMNKSCGVENMKMLIAVLTLIFISSNIYAEGKVPLKELEKGITHLKEKKDESRLYDIMVLLLKGSKRVEQNIPRAVKLAEYLDMEGYVSGTFILYSVYGEEMYGMKNPQKSVFYLKKAANTGNKLSMRLYAYEKLTGELLGKTDIKKAEKIFLELAESGYVDAADDLCSLYYLDKFGKEKRGKAFRWCNVTAKNGITSGFLILGVLYLEGKVVKKDNIKGAAFFYLADWSGQESGNKNLKVTLQEIDKNYSKRAQQEAKAMARKIMKEWNIKFDKQN